MRKVSEVFISAKDSGVVAHGHRVVCAGCNNDLFRFTVIYLNIGEHTHITCAQCGLCFCDNQCVNNESLIPPAQSKDN